MISVEFCATMARYNRWQNKGLTSEVEKLDEAAKVQDRGAFFGSILGTMNHLLWGDTIWMSRFDGWKKPRIGIPDSPRFTASWPFYKAARGDADTRIVAWADKLQPEALEGQLAWYSAAKGGMAQMPKWLCIQHFFNHQTHHRGQIHAMLTAAGGTPGDTDLFLMPEVTEWH